MSRTLLTPAGNLVASADPSSPTLRAGDLYFNQTTNRLRVYTGSAWVEYTDTSYVDTQLQVYSDSTLAVEDTTPLTFLVTSFVQSGPTEAPTQTNLVTLLLGVVPKGMQITSCYLAWQSYDLAASDTAYWTITLQKVSGNPITTGNILRKSTQATGGEAIVTKVNWNMNAATLDPTNSILAAGDLLVLNVSPTGSPTALAAPFSVTCDWKPA